jgi:hypothetical protein
MDEPLTMERGGETYYYHRDALGSITEVTNDTGDLVERYEYNVYGAVTIFDGAGITLTASAIGNPYLFTARRYVLRCALDAALTPRAATTTTARGCTARGWVVSSVWTPSVLTPGTITSTATSLTVPSTPPTPRARFLLSSPGWPKQPPKQPPMR